jgi:hypothetical protein
MKRFIIITLMLLAELSVTAFGCFLTWRAILSETIIGFLFFVFLSFISWLLLDELRKYFDAKKPAK